MATKRWIGNAVAVAQVDTVTVGGTVEIGDIFTLTINGKTVSIVASSTSTVTTATEMVTAWNASTIPEFAEITASNVSGASAVITLTADTAGKPFTVTATTTETGGGAADAQTFVRAASVANSGPNNYDVAANWDASGVPVAADTVIFENSAVDVLYGLDQSAVTLTALHFRASYTGKVGLPIYDEEGGYYQYRETYLIAPSTTVTIGQFFGPGSSRIKLNTSTIQTDLRVFSMGQSEDQSLEALIWKGTHASNALTVMGGTVAVAPFAGESATILTLKQTGDSSVRCASGVTLTTVDKTAGEMETNSAVTTHTVTGGTTKIMNGGNTTLAVRGNGTVEYNGTGTLASGSVGDAGHLDFSKDMRALAVTILERYGDASKISDPWKRITTLIVDINETSSLANLNLGTNIKLTRGTPT